MIDLNKFIEYEQKKILSKKNILSQVNPYEIFSKYVRFKLNKVFKSPLPPRDKHPSACISVIRGELMFTDFRFVKCNLRVFDFVSKLYNVSYNDALKIINRDFCLGLISDDDVIETFTYDTSSLIIPEQKESYSEINIRSRNWTKNDIRYWTKHGWNINFAMRLIKPISAYEVIRDDLSLYKTTGDELAYSYDYGVIDGLYRRKIYIPYAKDGRKFTTNAPKGTVQGILNPYKSDILIITSSLKDCGIFESIGINAIAPNSENQLFDDEFVEFLTDTYREVILWFDNDEPGVRNAEELAGKYNLKMIYNDKNLEKDPSALVLKYGYEFTKWYILNKLIRI